MFRNGLCKLCSPRTLSLRFPDRKYKSLLYTHQTLVNSYQSNIVIKNGHRLECKKYFRVSPVNSLPFPAFVSLVLRPVAKFLAMVMGIRIRRWWSKLSEEEKLKFWNNVHKRRKQISAATAGFIGLIVLYIAAHTEIDPITGKRQLILFSRHQMVELANSIANDLLKENKNAVFPPSHYYYKRTLSIAMQIINANTAYDHVKDRNWFLIVVNDPRVNAMVLPNGMIIVYSGLLNVANDAEIGVVLSHEISHCLLNHHVIRLSREHLLEMLWLIPVTLIWALFPVPDAILGFLLGHYLKNITMLLPYERDQEIEADKYGLMLAANACIDIRQALQFWKKMEKIDPNDKNAIWWLSTHPSIRTRINYIEDLLPNALELRKQNNCPPLDRYFWKPLSFF
ncbi:Peptidase M48 [Cinara cedri]|uniref:Metalloendopeptidase OMA1, mitochondrial n=1 Tax=Cinara cedri TaxID=506608 RepID=A0A5E4MFY4_9HEMI|nr:Peptidase M48 [Cinara cedri]